MLARLLFDRVLSYPGSLSECNFTSNLGLGRLHCLSDCVLSLCKSVCSYLVLLLRPGKPRPYGFHIAESLTSIYLHCRSCVTPIREALTLLARVAHSAWPFTLRRLWWRWRALPPRPAHINFSLQIAFQLSHDHHTAGRRKPFGVLHRRGSQGVSDGAGIGLFLRDLLLRSRVFHRCSECRCSHTFTMRPSRLQSV